VNARQANALRDGRRRAATGRAARRAYEAMHAQPERRVMVCATCGRSARWEGWIKALLADWAWEWKRARLVFLCPEQHEAAVPKVRSARATTKKPEAA